MKRTHLLAAFVGLAGSLALAPGCDNAAAVPARGLAALRPLVAATLTPPPRTLYVDHDGMLSAYALPLSAHSKPERVLQEDPGAALPPKIAISQTGKAAVGTTTELRIFSPPIRTFARKAASLIVPLTPAITEVGPSGADLVDLEFDPAGDIWLLNALGGEISMLQKPISRKSVAATTIQFGVPGTKTGGYTLVQARFNEELTLYVYANASAAQSAMLFAVPYPWVKPPSPFGVNLAQTDVVEPDQFPLGPPASYSDGMILGQYYGPRASSPPLAPTPSPVNVLAQFVRPVNYNGKGLFPSAVVNRIVGALVADPSRHLFYTLDAASGALGAYVLPLTNKAAPKFDLPCTLGPSLCSERPEHLFLAP